MKLYLPALPVTALLASATISPAQSYNLTDLGAVSGQTVSAGYGLNGLGHAVGDSSSPNGAIPTLFSGGKAFDLGTLETGDVSVATCLNGSAEVAGYEPFVSDPNNTSHAWVYSNGKLFDIHSPSLFPQGTRAAAINDSGVVVGQGNLTSSSFHAFVYANGQMVDLGPPGAYQASAVAINNNGQIAGNAYFTKSGAASFIYANGKFTYLTQPAGATVSVFGLNGVGQLAGAIYFNNGSPAHAASWSNGAWTDLGGIVGASANHATGINSAGEVIGTAFFPVKSYHPFIPGKHVAFVIRSGKPVDLNTQMPAGTGYILTDAIAINDSGEILCNASTPTSSKHAVLLAPK
jgi:probable HAF family extracellular repeat protein